MRNQVRRCLDGSLGQLGVCGLLATAGFGVLAAPAVAAVSSHFTLTGGIHSSGPLYTHTYFAPGGCRVIPDGRGDDPLQISLALARNETLNFELPRAGAYNQFNVGSLSRRDVGSIILVSERARGAWAAGYPGKHVDGSGHVTLSADDESGSLAVKLVSLGGSKKPVEVVGNWQCPPRPA
jgi:hypothetical protein